MGGHEGGGWRLGQAPHHPLAAKRGCFPTPPFVQTHPIPVTPVAMVRGAASPGQEPAPQAPPCLCHCLRDFAHQGSVPVPPQGLGSGVTVCSD